MANAQPPLRFAFVIARAGGAGSGWAHGSAPRVDLASSAVPAVSSIVRAAMFGAPAILED